MAAIYHRQTESRSQHANGRVNSLGVEKCKSWSHQYKSVDKNEERRNLEKSHNKIEVLREAKERESDH